MSDIDYEEESIPYEGAPIANLAYAQTVAELTDIVAEIGPNFVYRQADRDWEGTIKSGGCLYFRKDVQGTQQPDCIIGHLLARHGVNPLDLDDAIEHVGTDSAIGELIASGIIAVEDHRTKELLRITQTCQDEGAPWGRALENGIRESQNL